MVYGAVEDFYKPAVRKNVGVMVMLAGPPGSGKTNSALLLAEGLAGDRPIAFADTENDRALYYADTYRFLHRSISEPFRPLAFKEAAEKAQAQKAAVWICDSFSHEHNGPGGVLDYHEDELKKLIKGDESKRDSMNMVAWIKPKHDHKQMVQRFWQLNTNIILCCQADKKTEMVLQTEGKYKGKVIPVSKGYQPICAPDIPYAMTISLMMEDVKRPGVPTLLKPLLPGLEGLIDLDKPITRQTGERIAAWARGEKSAKLTGAVQVHPATAAAEQAPPAATASDTPPTAKQDSPMTVEEIAERAQKMADLFLATDDRAAHTKLTGDAKIRKWIKWYTDQHPVLYNNVIKPAITASWERTGRALEGAAA